MRIANFLRVAAALAGAWGCGACGADPPGYDTPESVLHDPDQDVWFVSNIVGAPLEKDGNGYIARVQPDGGMERRWIQGGRGGVTLHAPKGMTLQGDVLWVADIDVLRKFDRRSGRPLGEVPIPGASFVNDVSAAPDGSVYCTDTGLDAKFEATGTDAIWRVGPDGSVAPLIKDITLGQPNGIVAREHGVAVVSWRDGTFYQVDTRAGAPTSGKRRTRSSTGSFAWSPTVPAEPREAAWFATSWAGRCIYRFDTAGRCSTVGEPLDQPADCGFDATRRLLLVPMFGGNRVETRRP